MYNIKVEDFINIKQNKSPFNVNDMIHICKRKNNNKREYLFVNKFQGKHIPENPDDIIKLLNSFCDEVKNQLNKNEKVLIVGFAETATGIAEYLTYILSQDNDFKNSVVYHLQTSREAYFDCPKLFTFDEEHSHAVNQFLYNKNTLPYYDRVLFVEDEITTGNTILNFINEFKKINPNCKYSVSSILNWQNKINRELFEQNNIDRIFLVEGEIKNDLPKLNIDTVTDTVDYFNVKYTTVDCPTYKTINKITNSRKGINPNILIDENSAIIKEVTDIINKTTAQYDSIMVIGTEEFMFYPLMIAKNIKKVANCNVKYRATTRSPITSCNDNNYIIKDSITLPSAYEENRQTYLYNMSGNYNKIIVISDVNMTNNFKQSLILFAQENNKEISFVEIS